MPVDEKTLKRLREKARNLPLEPGVYLMRNTAGKIIYVGKAKALRNRVSSYFRSLDKHLPKVYRMVEDVEDFDTIVTGSEFEALVLECSLIKQNKPHYNILLKDDKGYHYIRVTKEEYPRITAAMQRIEDGATYIGPYTSSFVVRQTVEEVNRAFQLPTCGKKFPQDFRKARPCLNYHIKLCQGYCNGRINQREYGESIKLAMEFVTGNSTDTLQVLKKNMELAAQRMDFEKAAQYRDRIRAIERLDDHQKVVFAKVANQDIIALARDDKRCVVAMLKFRQQRLVDKLDFELGEIESLSEARAELIMSYYGEAKADIPKQISLDGECEDKELIERFLSEKTGHKVVLHVPERGEQLRLVNMASVNAAHQLADSGERSGREVAALDELARLLGLSEPPAYIEAYDISNMGSDTVVGGMVVFENGRPLKSAYRKFNIKTVEGTDDYASMREVLTRRLQRYEQEKDKGKGFGRLPDLILLDGGKGHVSAIKPIIDEMGLDIALFGMVKDAKHRTRAIAYNGGETAILSNRSAFTLVSKIQDEVHRFSITHMKQRHTKNAFVLGLTEVPGIGNKRAAALLRHFKTQKAIREASPEQLAEAPGMTASSAKKLYLHFHPEQMDASGEPVVT